jgi:hypothetical protein
VSGVGDIASSHKEYQQTHQFDGCEADCELMLVIEGAALMGAGGVGAAAS